MLTQNQVAVLSATCVNKSIEKRTHSSQFVLQQNRTELPDFALSVTKSVVCTHVILIPLYFNGVIRNTTLEVRVVVLIGSI